ncbi:nonstructural protein [Microviridae sp.]|nr:nonstructural protein [Microviridae sp.]
MKTEIYTIFDTKAQIYNKPFHQINEAVALRTATDLANDSNSEIAKSPQDYILFYLGNYDDQSAQFELCEPKSICKFHELVKNT